MATKFCEADRLSLLKAYAKSPLTLRQYVEEHGIGYSTFQRWAHSQGISLKKEKAERLDISKTGKDEQVLQASLSKNQRSCASHAPVQFMDITPNIFPKGKEEKPSPSVFPNPPFVSASPSSLSSPLDSLGVACQLDVSLPNGIHMTLHQVSLNHSIALIKGLI